MLLLCSIAAIASAGSGERLLIAGDYPDPTILRDGNDYYMTHSPFVYMPGFLIWHSTDLQHWEPMCRVLPETNGDLWAADLVKCNGRYYIYYPAGGTNYVMYADDIAGTWHGPIDLHIEGIDPGHVQDEQGRRYLHTSGGYVVRLSDDGLSTVGEQQKVYDGWQYPEQWETECFCLEGPKLTYHDGWYYLTSAQGGTAGPATSHMVVAARSKSPTGPWENSPYNPIVHTYSAADTWWSRGHGSLVDDSNGNWWMVYHAYRKGYHTMGRQTLITPIEWTADGWFVTSSRAVPDIEACRPNPSDDFASGRMGWQWMFWKEYAPQALRYGRRSLTITGKGSDSADGRLLIVNVPDTAYEVMVDVTPAKSGMAGLLLYYNEQAHAGITVAGHDAAIVFNGEMINQTKIAKKRKVSLRLRNVQGRCEAAISTDGRKTWTVIADDIDAAGLHHNRYGQFLSLRIALLAAGEGSQQFARFTYTAL